MSPVGSLSLLVGGRSGGMSTEGMTSGWGGVSTSAGSDWDCGSGSALLGAVVGRSTSLTGVDNVKRSVGGGGVGTAATGWGVV